jgi:hypothetical protein
MHPLTRLEGGPKSGATLVEFIGAATLSPEPCQKHAIRQIRI